MISFLSTINPGKEFWNGIQSERTRTILKYVSEVFGLDQFEFGSVRID